jgi:hypothetical protein
MALSALGWHAAAAPPKNVAVRSTVLDYAGDVAPRLNIQSDGLGDYVNASTLTSQIQAVGDWELDAKNPKGATRRLTIDFAEPIAGSGPGGIDPTPPPAAAFKFRVIAKCSLYGNSLLQFAAGAVKTCPLHIGFDYNGVTWAYQMDPYTAANGPFPQTNYATVTCIYPTSGSSPCSQWKFTPSGTYVEADGTVRYRNVAKLLEYQTSRGRSVVVDHGDFHVSFSMLIVR